MNDLMIYYCCQCSSALLSWSFISTTTIITNITEIDGGGIPSLLTPCCAGNIIIVIATETDVFSAMLHVLIEIFVFSLLSL